MTVAAYAASLGLSRGALYGRVLRGCPVAAPKHVRSRRQPPPVASLRGLLPTCLTVTAYAESLGISRQALYYRLTSPGVGRPHTRRPALPCGWCHRLARGREPDGSPICARCTRLPGPEVGR